MKILMKELKEVYDDHEFQNKGALFPCVCMRCRMYRELLEELKNET